MCGGQEGGGVDLGLGRGRGVLLLLLVSSRASKVLEEAVDVVEGFVVVDRHCGG